jgi:hypothetical protein
MKDFDSLCAKAGKLLELVSLPRLWSRLNKGIRLSKLAYSFQRQEKNNVAIRLKTDIRLFYKASIIATESKTVEKIEKESFDLVAAFVAMMGVVGAGAALLAAYTGIELVTAATAVGTPGATGSVALPIKTLPGTSNSLH